MNLERARTYLSKTKRYSFRVSEMTKMIETWDLQPLRYAGRLACLNALVALGVKDRHAFETELVAIEMLRMNDPKLRRMERQRLIMRERRLRQRTKP